MKKLKELDVGDEFVGFVIIRKKELKTKQNGEHYLVLELGDRSGRLISKMWNKADFFYRELEVGQVIKIMGKIHTFKDLKELHIEKIRKALEDEYNMEELIPISKKNIPELVSAFHDHLHSIKNVYLKQLCERLFPNEEILKNFLKTAPGKLWHHNYLYGMIEHLGCLLDLADVMKKHYPRLQIDLLKCGIILHNFGKEWEYSHQGFIDFTTEGRLIGHIILGYHMVANEIQKMESFPENLRTQLLHLILSHQSKIEAGSPVVPMSMEAIVLNLLNELDATTNAIERIIVNDQVENSDWTKYNNLLDRFIYTGNETDHNKKVKQSK